MMEAQDKNPVATQHGFTRRKFLKGVGAAGVGAIVVDPPLSHSHVAEAAPAPAAGAAPAGQVLKGPQLLVLNVNGQDRTVNVEPRTTLLNVLRNTTEPPVTGPKLVCDMGTCGACTVLLDDKPVYGCLTLAIHAVGHRITTAEGIGSPEKMSPVQAAFVEKDAMMCGYCTSGFVTSITGLLKQNPDPTLEQVKEYCKGNFCRCGTYPHIFEAALAAAKASKA